MCTRADSYKRHSVAPLRWRCRPAYLRPHTEGSSLAYNQPGPLPTALVVCQPELTDAVSKMESRTARRRAHHAAPDHVERAHPHTRVMFNLIHRERTFRGALS